tara:strand:+ start:276 stop:446 length:171 start_codon:yes stop_codon:yes gene_type:complete
MKLLSVKDVMNILGVSRAKIYQLIDSGQLTRVKIDGSTRFREESVNKLIELSSQDD